MKQIIELLGFICLVIGFFVCNSHSDEASPDPIDGSDTLSPSSNEDHPDIKEIEVAGTTKNCTDDDTNCPKWRAQGECEKNPGWMLTNCRLSCNNCPSCPDEDPNCQEWASIGECDRNPNWMLVNCKRSCHNCPKCPDKFGGCPYWASIGECERNRDWMLANCKRSCNNCPSCPDKDPDCRLTENTLGETGPLPPP